jgi:hypothetical protein
MEKQIQNPRLEKALEHALTLSLYNVFRPDQNVWVGFHHRKTYREIVCCSVNASQMAEIKFLLGQNFRVEAVTNAYSGSIVIQCLPLTPPCAAIPALSPVGEHKYSPNQIFWNLDKTATVEIVAKCGFSSAYSSGQGVQPVYEVRSRGIRGNLTPKLSLHTYKKAECYIGEPFVFPPKLRTQKQISKQQNTHKNTAK